MDPLSVHLLGAVELRSETEKNLSDVHEHMVKGNPAVATLNGIVASGSGDTGFPVGKLATEGKGPSPKTPVGTDAPDTEANEKDLEKPT